MTIKFCTFLGIGVIEMKMLKDCDVEVGDIIVGEHFQYEFVKYDSNNKSYPYRVIS